MEAKDLVNWRQLSKLLCGSPDTLRSNRIPKIHLATVNKILDAISKNLQTAKKSADG